MKRGSNPVMTGFALLLAFNICSAAETSEVNSLCRIQVGDISMGYRVSGDGYPLVMITGFGGTMDMWDPSVISILSRQYQVIVFDNRGWEQLHLENRIPAYSTELAE